MEYGFFKRRNSGNNQQRNSERRERGGYRERNDYRDRDRGGYRERNDNRDREWNRERERGGYRERGGNDQQRSFDGVGEESVFSKRVRAGKRRTYFFDVRKTRGDDFFITITESTRREDGYGGYRRHKIFLYKEDFNRFVASLNEVVEHVKTHLMPDFDYEEFDRRQAEWEAQQQNQTFDDERPEPMDDFEEDFEEEDFEEEDFEDEDLDEEDDDRPRSKSSERKLPPEDDLSW
ncbi:MAG: DUF3276 family protein [Saprospiraceae bacterium]|nr:DUF3276 family protein [Saprospiraceae bacterium]MDW8229636.1 DUF3276 family protein [Saprospiraceae bacterium]